MQLADTLQSILDQYDNEDFDLGIQQYMMEQQIQQVCLPAALAWRAGGQVERIIDSEQRVLATVVITPLSNQGRRCELRLQGAAGDPPPRFCAPAETFSLYKNFHGNLPYILPEITVALLGFGDS
jgi:hypothetical protein